MNLGTIARLFSFSSKQFHCISINATPEQIKTAYYKQAKTCHPDLNPNQSSTKFHELRNAYDELLKKSASKQNQSNSNFNSSDFQHSYTNNQYRKPNQKQNKKHESHGGYGSRGHRYEAEQMEYEDFLEFQKAFNSYLRNGFLKEKYLRFKPYFDEIMSFSGGFYGFEQNLNQNKFYKPKTKKEQRQKKEQQLDDEDQNDEDSDGDENKSHMKSTHRIRKLDIAKTIEIEKNQIGKTLRIKVQKQTNCHRCEFNPEQNYVKIPCKACQKTGTRTGQGKCQVCKGKKFSLKYDCKSCGNKRTIKKTVDEVFMIPEGMEDGFKLVLEGRGNQHKYKGKFGDLILTIRMASNEQKCKQKSNKYESQIEIKIFQAVLGCTTTVSTGKLKTQVKIPAGTQDGQVFKSNVSKRESRKYKASLIIPVKISHEQRIVFEKLKAIQQKISQSV